MASLRMGGGAPGLGGLLKDGYKHFSGLEQVIVKNVEACKQLSQITRTSLGPNGVWGVAGPLPSRPLPSAPPVSRCPMCHLLMWGDAGRGRGPRDCSSRNSFENAGVMRPCVAISPPPAPASHRPCPSRAEHMFTRL